MVISGVSLLGVITLNLVTPWLVRDLISYLTSSKQVNIMQEIIRIVVILVIAYILRAICTYLYRYLSHVAAWKLVGDMRVRVYEHLQKLSLRYYHDKQTGQLMSRTVNDSYIGGSHCPCCARSFTNVLIVIGVSIILFIINVILLLLH